MTPAELAEALYQEWDIAPRRVNRLAGGMNSQVWEVRADHRRWVAKIVSARDRAPFVAGLHAAATVDAGGIPAGAPVPGSRGALTVDVDSGVMALLAWVEGRALSGDRHEVPLIGATLGRAHRLLRDVLVPATGGFTLLDPDAPHLGAEKWVRPAVTDAVAAWEEIRPAVLSWGSLHGDPAPEAFLLPVSGRCGLIDWASCFHGPHLYDLASAVMYVGVDAADSLVDAYLQNSPMARSEVDAGLTTTLRLRWAVQASYFARRLVERDLTGISSGAENQKGLDDARCFLESL